MKMQLSDKIQAIFLTTLIFLSSHCYSDNIVRVNTSDHLQEVLAVFSKSSNEQLSIVLDSSVGYKLSGITFSLFVDKTIAIQSNNESIMVNITCFSNETTGLAFVNSMVTLIQLQLTSCGANLSTLPKTIINMFDSKHASLPMNIAALFFVRCQVHLQNIRMDSNSNGFSIFGYNLLSSVFQFLTVRNSLQKTKTYNKKTGGGMLVYFSDLQPPIQLTEISLRNITFENNVDIFAHGARYHCISEDYNILSYRRIYYAAGLTVKYTQTTYYVEVVIDGGTFIGNIGEYAGAILVINHRDVASKTNIQNSRFKENGMRIQCNGADISYFYFGQLNDTISNASYPLTIENSQFEGSLPDVQKIFPNLNLNHIQALNSINIGIYSPLIPLYFNLKKLLFTEHSTPTIDGTCLSIVLFKHSSIKTNKVNVTMTDIDAFNNSKFYNNNIPKSLFYFENIESVTIKGSSRFVNNLGSVICSKESNLYLLGDMIFINNKAENGGAIKLDGNVQLYFMNGLNASFLYNQAYSVGGAIYAKSTSYSKCGIQFKTAIKINFTDNFADTAGNSIFVTPMYQCNIFSHYQKTKWLYKYVTYFKLSRYKNVTTGRLPISTTPYSLDVFYKLHGRKYISVHNRTIQKFAGEKFPFYLKAVDKKHRIVFSFVGMETFHATDCCNNSIWLVQSGGSRALETQEPTEVNVALHTNCTIPVTAKIVFTIANGLGDIYYINILSCPFGFNINGQSGSCECSPVLNKLINIKCFIDQKTITRPKIGWIGVIENETAVVTSCPSTYCNTNPSYTFIKSTYNHGLVLVADDDRNDTIPICLNKRVGHLCGKCDSSYSVAFGTTECKQCSNMWLLTITMYALAGPLLVYLLYKLKLTLTTGTINGVIFYVQVANAGLLQYMSSSFSEYKIINIINLIYRSIIIFLNLDLGVPLCFYNGMNQLWKTGLGLLFPMYLLVIVLGIIIISHYSTWLSNRTSHLSIQVLVTVVHLSFSKLLVTLIEVFTAVTIYTANRNHRVWYWDGNVEYMGPSHYPLAIVTIVIVSMFLIPYIALLFFGNPLIKYSKKAKFYLRPIVEAVYAPYKDGKHHWFVLRLMLLLVIYLIYVLFITHGNNYFNITSLTLLFSFSTIKAFSRPFKSEAINRLDCWLMVNITIVYNTLWNKDSVIFNTIVLSLAIITFGLILIHHILVATNFDKKLSDKFARVKNYCMAKFSSPSNKSDRVQLQHTDSYYGSCRQYREPLVTEITCDSEYT